MILADDLLRSVKRAITVPASQPLLQDPDFYELMDEIISSRVVPLLESLDEEYFVTVSSVALVDSQQDYDIPYRAIGRGLRDLQVEDSSGNRRSIPKIALEDAQQYASGGDLVGFHFLGDKVRLLPRFTTAPSYTLQMWWRLPPSKLQAASAAAKIASISTGVSETTYTCTSVPSTITSSTACDIVRARSGSPILALDKTPSSVSGTQIVFAAADVPSGVAVGDYISLAGCSPVIQNVPNEMMALLRSYASYRVLVAIGDFDAAKVVEGDIGYEEKNIKSLLQPRIEGEPTVIINRQGLVRGNRVAAHRRLWYGL
jgi:hypothetical protein